MVLRLPLSACECTCPGKNLKGLLGKKNLSLFPNTNTKLEPHPKRHGVNLSENARGQFI
jgi:hypothetical protein